MGIQKAAMIDAMHHRWVKDEVRRLHSGLEEAMYRTEMLLDELLDAEPIKDHVIKALEALLEVSGSYDIGPGGPGPFEVFFEPYYEQWLEKYLAEDQYRWGMEHVRELKDAAIESGKCVIKAAEDFMAEQNRAAEVGETPNSEHQYALNNSIRNFRKGVENIERVEDAE